MPGALLRKWRKIPRPIPGNMSENICKKSVPLERDSWYHESSEADPGDPLRRETDGRTGKKGDYYGSSDRYRN